MARNKVIYGGEVLIDLTGDTVTRADVQDGVQFHLPSGEISTGTSTKDSDTSDATAQPAEILSGKTAYARGTELTGTMPNNGAVDATIDDKDDGQFRNNAISTYILISNGEDVKLREGI